MKGLDGLQGPIYVGTGCVFRRVALYGFDAPSKKKAPSKTCNCWPKWCCLCCGSRKKNAKTKKEKKKKPKNREASKQIHALENIEEGKDGKDSLTELIAILSVIMLYNKEKSEDNKTELCCNCRTKH